MEQFQFLEVKDILLVLIGVAGSFLANVLYKHYERKQSATAALEGRLKSLDPIEKRSAIAQCMFAAGKWYLVGNIFWVVAGAAWSLEGALKDTESSFLFIRAVLGATSLIAIFSSG